MGSALKAAVFTCCINLNPEIGASFALWITGAKGLNGKARSRILCALSNQVESSHEF